MAESPQALPVVVSGSLQQNFDALNRRLAAVEDRASSLEAEKVGGTGLRIVRGVVNTAGSGTIVEGTEFSITRNGAGDVTINFSPTFSDVPGVVGMAGETNAALDVKLSPSTATTKALSRLIVFNPASELKDAIFHFIAIGPK